MAEIKKFYAWIGPHDGYAAMYWNADGGAGYYDWVGLYSSQQNDQNDYLTWYWATKASSYVTSEYINSGLSVRYFTWVALEGSETNYTKLNLDEVDDEGKYTVTPISALASLSGSYTELMRSRDLNLDREVNAAEEFTLKPGCWVEPYSRGYAKVKWTAAETQGDRDWVALYSDVFKDNSEYISGTWQWAKGNSSYNTSHAYTPGIHARYIKAGSPYIALRRSKPIATGYFDLSSIYTTIVEDVSSDATTIDITKIVKIMADQLGKAVKGEPSVFSPGIWPFGDNLLFKNLSYEEVKVIRAELAASHYYDVIMIYYETYKMAIQIAEDGERNAKRHAFWQISLVQKFGKDFAQKLGDAHERGRPGTAEDNRVDGLNNAAALKYAADHPGIDPALAAEKMWNEGLIVDYNDAVAPEHTKDEL